MTAGWPPADRRRSPKVVLRRQHDEVLDLTGGPLTVPAQLPPAPQNVRFLIGQRVIPVDCRYDGWDAQVGAHVWTALAPWPRPTERGIPTSMQADLLPADTLLRVELEQEGDRDA